MSRAPDTLTADFSDWLRRSLEQVHNWDDLAQLCQSWPAHWPRRLRIREVEQEMDAMEMPLGPATRRFFLQYAFLESVDQEGTVLWHCLVEKPHFDFKSQQMFLLRMSLLPD
jgi:hypothetical protein